MARNDNRPSFTPNTEPYAPNTVEEQKRDHEEYWDERHDREVFEKLKGALRQKGLIIYHPNQDGASAMLLEIVTELRLTTY